MFDWGADPDHSFAGLSVLLFRGSEFSPQAGLAGRRPPDRPDHGRTVMVISAWDATVSATESLL